MEPLGIRLAAIDIDGTLGGPDGRIGATNVAAVASLLRRGVHVVLASGRSHANMLPFHRQLELRGAVVSVHGAVVRDGATGRVLRHDPLPTNVVEAITLEGRRRPGVAVVHYRGDGVAVERRTRITDYDQTRNAERQVFVADLLAAGGPPVDKVMWLAEREILDGVLADARTAFDGAANVTPTDPEYLEFTPRTSDKAVGVAHVARELGIAREAVMAVGDGNNDAPMLAWAGLGVAVAHATPAARAAADVVGPDGDPADAFARALDAALRLATSASYQR